jgi:two-component system, chemotaxis family, chemotaxis protein CheV
MQVKSESYLKSGSNELRVLEFQVRGISFGINILKVKKIASQLDCHTQVPDSHPAVRGMFRDRETLVPVIDLTHFLELSAHNDSSMSSHPKVIVTEFFGKSNGFLVDQINWIHHFLWEDLIDASQALKGVESPFVSGIVRPDRDHSGSHLPEEQKRMIFMLDYESIILDLCPELERKSDIVFEDLPQVDGAGMRALIAEDSPAVRTMLEIELSESGFEVVAVSDGKSAFEQIEANPDFQLVITDVEMPRMDGLALLVAIREKFGRKMPVLIYSSIGDMGMKRRAEFLEADGHITKLNVNELRMMIGKILKGEAIPSAVDNSTAINQETLAGA